MRNVILAIGLCSFLVLAAGCGEDETPPGPVTDACGALSATDHVVITEVNVGPTEAEFIEIYNPTGAIVDLSDYYLYNATNVSTSCHYYNVVDSTQCGDSGGDFALQFPAGASIGPGQYVVVAVTGAANYCATYYPGGSCVQATFEIPPTGADDPSVPNMRGVWDTDPGNFTTFGFLTATYEDVVLFRWPGGPVVVEDIDYFIWGANTDVRTDKTNIAGYLEDTLVGLQRPAPGGILESLSYQRVCLSEGGESKVEGNGITGHDETSEDLRASWRTAPPTPGAPASGAGP